MAAYGDEIRIDTSQIEGLAEVFERFPLEVQNRMLQRSLEQGAIVIRQAIMTAAPVRLDQKTAQSTSLEMGMVKADMRIAARRSGRGWLIGASAATQHVVRWLELGHVLIVGGKRKRGKGGVTVNVGGKVVGNVPPHPFLRPGFDASWRAGLNFIYAELIRQMDGYWQSSVRKIKKAS